MSLRKGDFVVLLYLKSRFPLQSFYHFCHPELVEGFLRGNYTSTSPIGRSNDKKDFHFNRVYLANELLL